MKLITISVPVFNEEDNIDNLIKEIDILSSEMSNYKFEFIFTDNCSDDNTYAKLLEHSRIDNRVKIIRFSRNVGFQKSILLNYQNSLGDAVIQIDADLQDSPQYIKNFIDLWESGYDVVYGIRTKRTESRLMNSMRSIYYRILNLISEYPIPVDAGDFRLLDRQVVNALLKHTDMSPYIRGSVAEIGFKQIGVEYQRNARITGKSKFSMYDLISLGMDGIFNHSMIPLRVMIFLGLFTIIFSFFGFIYYVVAKFFIQGWPEGLSSTNTLILFSIGLNSLFFGIIGEYVARTFKNVKKGPLAHIVNKVGFKEDK
jgi:polyisoprenyl-phosphate glycosyltransferase